MRRKIGLLALIGVLLFFNGPLAAEDGFYVVGGGSGVGTKITSLPYEIKNPGFYYLTKNLTTTGDGIYVNTSDVTLDLMGFKLQGPGSINTTANGISLGTNVRNVEIRNGTLRSWDVAIGNEIDDSYHSDCRIINVRMLFSSYGIKLNGYNLQIGGCTINDMQKSGISINGSGIINKNVINYAPNAYCINVSGFWTVSNNALSNAHYVLGFFGEGIITGNWINCLDTQFGLYLTDNPTKKILVSQNVVAGSGSHLINASAYVFYVGNVGLTNTNSLLAPVFTPSP